MQTNEYLVETENGLEIKQEHLDRLAELKKTKESAEKELKALTGGITNELKERFGQSTTKVSGYNYVVKGNFYDVVFDMERFIAENFALYVQYLVPHYSKPTYTLVSATREKKNNVW